MVTILQVSRSMPAHGRDANHFCVRLAAALCGVLMIATAAHAAANNVSVAHGWLRLVVPTRPAAGYFELNNSTDAAIELIGASSSGCGQLMLHRSRNVNGVETMHPVKSVQVAAHGSVSFTPGGYHLMCMSPAATLSPGKNVPITLKFADGMTITADFVVHGADGE
jgi:periplasmic copper chaperone A